MDPALIVKFIPRGRHETSTGNTKEGKQTTDANKTIKMTYHPPWPIEPRCCRSDVMAATNLSPSIGCGRGERGGGEANGLGGGIKDGIEPLKESKAVDEVETLSGGSAKVADDQVDAA